MKINISKIRQAKSLVAMKLKSPLKTHGNAKQIAVVIALFAFALILLSANTNAMYIDSTGTVHLFGNIIIDGKIDGRIQDKTGFVMPVGTILSYYGANQPQGWLICDGRPIPDGAEFDELKKHLRDNGLSETNVPDLQGQFLRGTDTSGNIDPDKGRTVGSKQGDEFKHHTHDIYITTCGTAGVTGGIDGWHVTQNNWGGPLGSRITETGGNETRPKNVAVNFLIKY